MATTMTIESAFPQMVRLGVAATSQGGLTMRDWFATFAPEPKESDIQYELARNTNHDRTEIIADLRYAHADAMMERRTK